MKLFLSLPSCGEKQSQHKVLLDSYNQLCLLWCLDEERKLFALNKKEKSLKTNHDLTPCRFHVKNKSISEDFDGKERR